MKKLLLTITLLISTSLAYCANNAINLILCSNSNKSDPGDYGAMIFDQGIFFTDTVPHKVKIADDNDCTISTSLSREYITKNCLGGNDAGYCYAPVFIGKSYRNDGVIDKKIRFIGYLSITLNDLSVHNFAGIGNQMNFKIDINYSLSDSQSEVRVHLPNS